MSDNMNYKREIIQDDAPKLPGDVAPGVFDAVITDLPCASGGRRQTELEQAA